jgi:hypothetical protein
MAARNSIFYPEQSLRGRAAHHIRSSTAEKCFPWEILNTYPHSVLLLRISTTVTPAATLKNRMNIRSFLHHNRLRSGLGVIHLAVITKISAWAQRIFPALPSREISKEGNLIVTLNTTTRQAPTTLIICVLSAVNSPKSFPLSTPFSPEK